MKHVAPLVVIVGLSSCASYREPASDNLNAASKANRLSFYLGKRQLDRGEWDPVDEQTAFGVDYAHVPDAIGFEVGLQASRDSEDVGGADVRSVMTEVSAGLRVEAGDDIIRPYAGVGVAYLNFKIDPDVGPSEDDYSIAAYGHAGVTCDLGSQFYVGLDARFLFGSSLTLLGEGTDADYGQVALLVGFAF